MANIWKVADYPEDDIPIMKHITIDDVKEEFLNKGSIVAIARNGEIYILRKQYNIKTDENFYGFFSIKPNKIIGFRFERGLEHILDLLATSNKEAFVFDDEDTLFRWALDQKED